MAIPLRLPDVVGEALGLHRLHSGRSPVDRAVPFAIGACLLVRRCSFRAVGGFDERFWLYGEDADLCRRFRDRGWRVRCVPEASALHVGGSSSDSPEAAETAFEHFQRGTEHFIAKYYGVRGLVLHRVGLLVGCALRVVLLAVRRDRRARERLATRKAIAARLLRALASRPRQVAS